MAQEVGKGQLSVLLVIVCDRLWLPDALEERQQDLLKDIVVLDLCLDNEGYRSEVEVTLLSL